MIAFMTEGRTIGPFHWAIGSVVKPLAIALAFVFAALLWSLPLQHVIAYPFVFLFFGAIMGSAWFGGRIAGFVAVVVSSLVVSYFFVPPFYSLEVEKESQSFFAAFIICAIFVTVVSSARKHAEVTITVARDELDAKVRERTAELELSNAEIEERERQLRQITEAIPQQIWRTDAEGRIEYGNHHLCEATGLNQEQISGQGLFHALHPEDEPLFTASWNRSLSTGNSLEFEARVQVRDGSYRWFLIRSIPQRTPQGAIACWYGTHIDIEQQHRAQQELAHTQEDLAHLSRTLSMAEMAASIAHELNQPLTAVVTHAYACREWLNTSPANLEKASATAEKIVQESTRASEVIRRVRALFRKDDQVRESTDINRLIQDLVRLLRDEAIRRDVSIRIVPAPGLPRLEVDPVQIQQVLLNLAMNGMEAMAASPRRRELILRSAHGSDDQVVVSVEDHGPGVPPEISTKIFEPFFSTRRDGTGMGLAICRTIVEAHDGRIWTSEAPGGGAIFQFTLRTQT